MKPYLFKNSYDQDLNELEINLKNLKQNKNPRKSFSCKKSETHANTFFNRVPQLF